jgi:P27 family predicted phage terminase small subunit
MPTPKKPIEQHILNGTKPNAFSFDEPTFASGRPKMPADLCPVAEAEWKRIVPKLCKRKQLTKADASCIEIYCRIFARWRKVEAMAAERPLSETTWLDKNGNEHIKVEESPASKIAARLESQMRAYLVQFSATPVSRKLTKPPKIDNPDPMSKEEALLFHRPDERERLRAEEAADKAMLDSIDLDEISETLEPQTEAQKLMAAADSALAEEKIQ